MEIREDLPDKGCSVGRVHFLFVEVSGTEQSVNPLLPGHISDIGQRVAQAISQFAGCLGLVSQPGKGPVQVEVGKEQELRC